MLRRERKRLQIIIIITKNHHFLHPIITYESEKVIRYIIAMPSLGVCVCVCVWGNSHWFKRRTRRRQERESAVCVCVYNDYISNYVLLSLCSDFFGREMIFCVDFCTKRNNNDDNNKFFSSKKEMTSVNILIRCLLFFVNIICVTHVNSIFCILHLPPPVHNWGWVHFHDYYHRYYYYYYYYLFFSKKK